MDATTETLHPESHEFAFHRDPAIADGFSAIWDLMNAPYGSAFTEAAAALDETVDRLTSDSDWQTTHMATTEPEVVEPTQAPTADEARTTPFAAVQDDPVQGEFLVATDLIEGGEFLIGVRADERQATPRQRRTFRGTLRRTSEILTTDTSKKVAGILVASAGIAIYGAMARHGIAGFQEHSPEQHTISSFISKAAHIGETAIGGIGIFGSVAAIGIMNRGKKNREPKPGTVGLYGLLRFEENQSEEIAFAP